jgi:TolB-like protein
VEGVPRAFSGGRYVTERVLGKGGQKVVYLVRDTRLERACALALVEGDALEHEDAMRLKNEARSLALAGAHPNVVTIYDLGEEDGRPFIVSEYVPGGDLAGELQRAGGRVSVPRTIALMRDLLRALMHVHQCGIVHRDLKPNNVWIAAGGTPKLGDFGLALRENRERLTLAGGIVGTPSYLAPEQIQGEAVDGRADLYALGCMIYELLTGKPPFGGVVTAVIAQHLHAAPTPLMIEDLPPGVAQLIAALLAKTPSARPESASKALELLEAALAGHSSAAAQIPAVQPHAIATVSREQSGAPLALPNKPSLAVLRFTGSGADTEDAYFGEAIAEEMIVSLSKFASLFVIARSSSFRYSSEDRARIRSELGVRYIVDGRVRKIGDRVRISIELLDANDGHNIWAERYDRPFAEIFEVQKDVTRTIVATLVNRVEAARLEEVKRTPTHSLEAYDCLLRGKDHHHRYSLEDNLRAQELFARAAELDPHFSLAHAWLACSLGQCAGLGQDMDFSRFMDALAKAHASDPNESECHRLLAALHMRTGRLDDAIAYQERALALNPNDDRIVSQMGEMCTYLGKHAEALEWIELAMRLNPYCPDWMRSDYGRALYFGGRYADALATLQRIAKPRIEHHVYIASSHLQLGDRPSAERSRAAIIAANPKFTAEQFLKSMYFKRANDLATLANDLRALAL